MIKLFSKLRIRCAQLVERFVSKEQPTEREDPFQIVNSESPDSFYIAHGEYYDDWDDPNKKWFEYENPSDAIYAAARRASRERNTHLYKDIRHDGLKPPEKPH